MSFKYFPGSRLEELIGERTLSKVAETIPTFDSTIDTDSLYSKKNLIRIIHSFFDSSHFSRADLRKEFLQYQKESQIDHICELFDIDKSLPFNEKCQLLTAKGWRNRQFCESFCQIFDLPEKMIPEDKAVYKNSEVISSCNKPYKVLKEYQSRIAYQALHTLRYRNSRFIIQMPTGSGKTRTAIEIISNLFNETESECIVLWLVYSEELCEQAIESFIDVWTHVGTKDVTVVRAWGINNLDIDNSDDQVFAVGGFQKLHNLLQKDPNLFERLKKRVSLIVVDEAHRILAPTYKKVVDSLFGSNTSLIGLTATPGRGIENDDENRKLSEYFNSEKLTIDTPGDKPVFKYLKSIGILSHAEFKPLITSPTFSMTDKELSYLSEYFDFPPGFIKKLGEDQTRNIEIINELRSQLNNHEKALFFGCSVEHSKFICSILNFLGIDAAHVDGSTDKGSRQSILNDFKKGKLKIICNFGILSTGFDAPKTDLVFIARPTKSIVLYSQMIGRGLRGPLVGGTSSCTVVTVKDNILGLPNESDIFTYFDEYFEN